jgi:hypothetical protein
VVAVDAGAVASDICGWKRACLKTIPTPGALLPSEFENDARL